MLSKLNLGFVDAESTGYDNSPSTTAASLRVRGVHSCSVAQQVRLCGVRGICLDADTMRSRLARRYTP